MDNTFKNRFKKFLDIVMEGNLNLVEKFKEIFKKSGMVLIKKEPKLDKEVIKIDLNLSHNDSEEEFEAKLLDIRKQNLPEEAFTAIHEALIKTSLSTKFVDKTIAVLEHSSEEQVVKAFEPVIQFDRIEVCKKFLTSPDKRFKKILSSDNDYPYYLGLSIKYGAKQITEYFLENKKFSDLLTDPCFAENCLKSCLLLKETGVEIVNMLLSHNINLSCFKDKDAKITNLDNKDSNEFKNVNVVNQINKKLLHEELMEEFTENTTILSKPAKRTKL